MKPYLILLLAIASFLSLSQEICNNQIDDDLDGFIDCMDEECLKNKEGVNWYFGGNAALNFASGSPVALSGSAINTWEGCSAISDDKGQLLFYTDGITVYNKNHTVMSNGDNLYGDQTSTQSGVICQIPGLAGQYYVFTLSSNGIYYSNINMALDGGLGAVTQKNTFLQSMYSEKLELVKSCGNMKYWLLTASNSQLYVYLIDVNGISLAQTVNTNYANRMYGYMQVSPSGKYLAMANYGQSLELFDFDLATGIPSNQILFGNSLNNQFYGIEFAPSEKYIYATHMGRMNECRLYQYELNSNSTDASLNSSAVLIASTISPGVGDTEYGALQLGPDYKIYMAIGNTYHDPRGALSVINAPDAKGMACDFKLDAISLGTGKSRSGLPNFSAYQVQNVHVDGTKLVSCGQDIRLWAQGACSYAWVGPDNFTAIGSNVNIPSASALNAGTYTVTMDLEAGCTIQKSIDVQVACTTPLYFLRFSGSRPSSTSVALTWETAHTQPHTHFEIYKSYDGSSYELLDEMEATSQSIYKYTDIQVKEGEKAFYYIKTKPTKQMPSYTSTAISPEGGPHEQLYIYPNPFNESFTLHMPLKAETKSTIQIFDISGKVRFTGIVDFSVDRPITLHPILEQGTYLMKALIEDHVYWVHMVKN